MSHLMLAFKNLLSATLVSSTLVAFPVVAQTTDSSIPKCVPADTASGYTLPDRSGYTLVAQREQPPQAELCVNPDSPQPSYADQAFLVKFSGGLAKAFASHPEAKLPLSGRLKGRFTGKNRRPDIEITSSGVFSVLPQGYESVTYLFTALTTDKNHPLVVGQIRVSRPATGSSEEAPGIKPAPYPVPADDSHAPV